MATGVPVILQSAAPATPVLINGIAPNQSLTIKITSTGALIVEDANANIILAVDTQTPLVYINTSLTINNTVTPLAPLDLKPTSGLRLTIGSNGPILASNLYNSGGWKYIANGTGTFTNINDNNSAGDITFGGAPSGSAGNAAALTQRFAIYHDGSIVIGAGAALGIVGLGFPDAANIVFGTATGTKIGTAGGASGQKIGFFNATPIVQPLLATGAGHTVDDVITTLQNLGLVRQS